MELSESPAAPADDTNTCSGETSLVFNSSSGEILNQSQGEMYISLDRTIGAHAVGAKR